MHERTTDAAKTAVPLPEQPGRSYTPGASEQGMTNVEAERLAGPGGRSHDPLTRPERLLVTVFVTMFGTMLAAGALGFTTLSGQLLDMQEQIGALRAEMHEGIGELSERMTRIETLIETHLVPASDVRDPAGP